MTATPRRHASRTRVKICGIRSPELARTAIEAGADAIGVVIDVPDSPRNLSIDEARTIAESLPPLVLCVAVLRNPPREMADRWPGPWFRELP